MSIQQFVDSPIGKPLVWVLTFLSRVTVMKRKDAEGKVVEKTPLDSVNGTIIAGVILLGVLLLAVRIAAMVS